MGSQRIGVWDTRVLALGLLRGAGAATPEEPHRNLMNAPWWADGYHEVHRFADELVFLDEIQFFSWEG